MTTVIACLTATVSTVAFLILWFKVVNRELKDKRNTVKSAENQLIACRKNHLRVTDDSKKSSAKAVLNRSEDIYCQSVTLYNQALKKPQNYIPGFFMGFRKIQE
ncbi:MAG: hypothetical protein RR131_07660 [Anaerovorax sp.]